MRVRGMIRCAAHVALPVAMLTCVLALAGCGGARDSAGAPDTTPVPGPIASSTSPGTPVSSADTSSQPRSTTTVAPTSTTAPSAAEVLMREMTLRDKAAQIFLFSLDGTTVTPDTQKLLLESPPGGFLLLSRNVAGIDQVRSLCEGLQRTALEGGSPVGLLIAVDQEGGTVQRIHSGVPRVPAARTLGEDGGLVKARALAAETAAGLLAMGVNMNLAPVADVVSDPGSFLYRRTYGGDPTVVATFVKAITETFVREGLIVTVKHFPGHGSASGDSHGGIVISDASEYDLATIHLPPFKAALSVGVDCVMMAHIVVEAYDPTVPASLSKVVVDEVLRHGLGFAGVVVTDDLEMAGAAAPANGGPGAKPEVDPGGLAVRALEAGCDLLISTGPLPRQRAMIDAIVEAVRVGRVGEPRLDEAVRRVVELKLRHGLTTLETAP